MHDHFSILFVCSQTIWAGNGDCLTRIMQSFTSKMYYNINYLISRVVSSSRHTQTRTTSKQYRTNAKCCPLISTRSAWVTTRLSTVLYTITTMFTTWPDIMILRHKLWRWSQTSLSRINRAPKYLWTPGTFMRRGRKKAKMRWRSFFDLSFKMQKGLWIHKIKVLFNNFESTRSLKSLC